MRCIAMPPYSDLVGWTGKDLTVTLNISNYLFLLTDTLYYSAYLSSLKIAVISTFLCLLIGYPIAYAIARMPPATRNIALMLVILPSWTSFLIRIYAWIGILKNNGLINNFLMWLGMIDQPLQILHTALAVYIGIVYAYLPFMVLPLYTNLVKLDERLLEAAYDLGAQALEGLPEDHLAAVARSGIIAGSHAGDDPGGGRIRDSGTARRSRHADDRPILWEEFFNNRDWPVASAVAIVMLVLLMMPIMIFHRYAVARKWRAS